jgi:hypothetical protein
MGKKANISDICELLDAKANIEDINKILHEINRDIETKVGVEEFNASFD